MRKLILAASCVLAAVVGGSGNAVAQGRPDSQALLAAQRKALARLAFMDGVWRGPGGRFSRPAKSGRSRLLLFAM